MDDIPFYKKPWFYIAAWLAFLLIVYGWQIVRLGGMSSTDILLDVILFVVFLILWMAFFAQFVLPVRTFRDRQKIFDRLITYLLGGHGPAIFIRNGELIKREGEERKKGPGVLWLDTASAAVTRTAVAIKQTMGPGVHFIDSREFIAGTVDLHVQSQSIGPKESDKPFVDKKEEQTDEQYNQIQDRRKQVGALTRDGIEVIPNISVSFRIDTGFPQEGKPGSRFGYRTGITRKDREREKKDQEAIRNAILGEGINPNVPADSNRHRVAWNQLPALLAVDLWREYVAKFTLDELFKPTQQVPAPPPPAALPTEEEIDPLSQPIQVSGNRETMQDGLAKMLREINLLMERAIKWLEGEKDTKDKKTRLPEPSVPKSLEKHEPQMKTALQVINDMVKARLTQPSVDVLDDTGQYIEGNQESREYKLLQARGLKVLSVGINTPRFNSEIEDAIIHNWKASWLVSAKTESQQIDRRRNIFEATAQEQAKRQYAGVLSREINEAAQSGKLTEKQMLKTLLMRSHSLIQSSDQLRRRMSTELQDIEEMIKWIEENGS